MNFASDNTGPVHPNVMSALNAANMGYALPYGADDATAQAVRDIRDVFEAPEAAVYLVSLGTAANSLILATLSQPWETVFCHTVAHIHEDECNAPEFYSGGTKLTLVPGDDAKMTCANSAQIHFGGRDSRRAWAATRPCVPHPSDRTRHDL
jgi:threonine aldolase